MSETLRPFSLGEILDRTAQLYRSNFLLFTGVAAVPTVAMLAAVVPFGAAIGFLDVAAVKGNPAHPIVMGVLIGLFALLCIPVVIGATVVSQAAMTSAAIRTHFGQKLKVREAIKSVWPRFWRYLWLLVLQCVFAMLLPAGIAAAIIGPLIFFAPRVGLAAVAVGTFLTFILVAAAFIVLVWRMLGYSMAMAVSVAEDKPAWDSIWRAEKLCTGSRGRIFVMFLLVWALSMIISVIGYIPIVILMAVAAATTHQPQNATAMLVVAEILNVLMNFALQTLITPVYITALVLFYYDQRIRAEGYDIEWMMEQAGLTNLDAAPSFGQNGPAFEPVAGPDTVKEL